MLQLLLCIYNQLEDHKPNPLVSLNELDQFPVIFPNNNSEVFHLVTLSHTPLVY